MATDDQDKLLEIGLAWDKAVNRLADDQGRVARNNARRAALTALRRMRAALDRHFPVIPKQRKARAKRTPQQRVLALWKDGYRPVDSATTAGRLIRLGVKPKPGPATERGRKSPVAAAGKASWFPTWALAAKTRVELTEAKRSHNKREELRAIFLIEEAAQTK